MRGKTRKHNHTLLHPMAATVVFQSADLQVMSDSSWQAFIGTRHFSFRPPILFPWWRWWCFIAETCAEWRMSHAFDKYSRSPRPPYLSSEPRCLHLGLESRIISHKTAQGTCWPAALKLLYKISYLDKNHSSVSFVLWHFFPWSFDRWLWNRWLWNLNNTNGSLSCMICGNWCCIMLWIRKQANYLMIRHESTHLEVVD